jgi:hypothetical protein
MGKTCRGVAREVEYLVNLGGPEEKALMAATRYEEMGKRSPRIEFCIQTCYK